MSVIAITLIVFSFATYSFAYAQDDTVDDTSVTDAASLSSDSAGFDPSSFQNICDDASACFDASALNSDAFSESWLVSDGSQNNDDGGLHELLNLDYQNELTKGALDFNQIFPVTENVDTIDNSNLDTQSDNSEYQMMNIPDTPAVDSGLVPTNGRLGGSIDDTVSLTKAFIQPDPSIFEAFANLGKGLFSSFSQFGQ